MRMVVVSFLTFLTKTLAPGWDFPSGPATWPRIDLVRGASSSPWGLASPESSPQISAGANRRGTLPIPAMDRNPAIS